jgi:hypothetical protein
MRVHLDMKRLDGEAIAFVVITLYIVIISSSRSRTENVRCDRFRMRAAVRRLIRAPDYAIKLWWCTRTCRSASRHT